MRRRFSGRLRTLAPTVIREVSQSMYPVGLIVADRAQGLIMAGSASGSRHVASRPGEAPNNDMGDLVNGIFVVQTKPLKVRILSTAGHAADMELGNSRVSERPYMRPAADETAPEIGRTLRRVVDQAVRRHLRG